MNEMQRYAEELHMLTPMERFVRFITMREKARIRYESTGRKGDVPDVLISRFKFCNINREHDAVTVWVRNNVRDLLSHSSINVALTNLALCRVFNQPSFLEDIVPMMLRSDWPVVGRTIVKAQAEGRRMLRGAYLIVSHGEAGRGVPVAHYYAGAIYDILTSDFSACDTFGELSSVITGIMGFSDFLSNQILTDFRYMPQSHGFADRNSFVLCGPGTRRGISRLKYGSPKTRKPPGGYPQLIRDLREDPKFLRLVPMHILKHFDDPNNLSNCFCEWDKHERALDEILAGGKPHLKHHTRK